MRFNQIVIDPGHGWADASGQYDRGSFIDAMAEVDAVDAMIKPLLDGFETAALKYTLLQTRKRPGLTPVARCVGIEPCSVILSLHAGWQTRPNAWNQARVVAQAHDPLVELVVDEINRWGRVTCASFKPVKLSIDDKLPLLSVPNCLGLHIEPFELNGPDAVIFAARLGTLASALGVRVADYLQAQNSALKFRPLIGRR